MENVTVHQVDILSFAGKWYSLYSFPTMMTRQWFQTTETYIIHPDGYYAVFTTYRISEDQERRFVRSKLFVVPGTRNTKFKSQYIWPVKSDYWVVELGEDYSYAVIGHPKHKFLNIISRKPGLPDELLSDIKQRCHLKGYDVSKLVSQQHVASLGEEVAN